MIILTILGHLRWSAGLQGTLMVCGLIHDELWTFGNVQCSRLSGGRHLSQGGWLLRWVHLKCKYIYVVVVLNQNSPLTAALSLCYRECERLDSLFTPWRWRPWCPAAVGWKPDCTEWPSAYYHSAQTGQSFIWCLHQVRILRSLIYKIYVYV